VPGSGCDHRCRHLRSWPERVRGERVDSLRQPVGGGCERIVRGPGWPVWGLADVRGHGYTHVIPDAISLADTSAFRGR